MNELLLIFVLVFYGFTSGLCETADISCRKNITVDLKFKENKCSSQTQCNIHSLNDLRSEDFVDGTCVEIRDQNSLNDVMTISNIVGLHMRGTTTMSPMTTTTTTTTINCTNEENSGLQFLNTTNVFLQNLQFTNCGHGHNSTVLAPNTTLPPPKIYAAIFFEASQNINVRNVAMKESYGYGIVSYDVFGEIVFDRLNTSYNRIVGYNLGIFVERGYSSGGGAYLEYTSEPSHNVSLGAKIMFTNCNFEHNRGDEYSVETGKGIKEGHIGFGRGGALGVIMMTNILVSIHLNITDCIFINNSAAWGGGFYARFRNKVSNSSLFLLRNSFKQNNATYSGGGMFTAATQSENMRNSIQIINCSFDTNIADRVGGAYGQLHNHMNEKVSHLLLTITNSTFSNNAAEVGSALGFQHVKVTFESVTIVNCTSKDIDGQGAIYAHGSHIFFKGFSEIAHNDNTSLVADYTNLHIMGELKFSYNKGQNGGAIGLYGQTYLFLYNSTRLNLTKNRARQRGGAVYVKPAGPYAEAVFDSRIYTCFFSFRENLTPNNFTGRIYFKDNRAKLNGDSIYITTIKGCLYKSFSPITTFLEWDNFTFQPENITHVITRAVNVSIFSKDWNTYPGKVFTPKIILTDEIGNKVSELIDVKIFNNNFTQQCTDHVKLATTGRFIVNEYDNITLILEGNNQIKDSFFGVQVTLAYNESIFYRLNDLKLQPCYFGYSLVDHKSCHCNPEKNSAKGIAFCLHDRIYLYENRWAKKDQLDVNMDKEITSPCPIGYCKCRKPSNKEGLPSNVCLYDAEANIPRQCKETRDQSSRVCSRCSKEYPSVVFGSENCSKECHGANKTAVWKILGIFFACGVLVAIIIIINISYYKTYMSVFLYYYQVLPILPPSAFQYVYGLKHFCDIINFDGAGHLITFCLFEEFNDLQKMAFNYVIPMSMLIWLFIIYKSARLKIGKYFTKNNCINAFAIISVLAYADITKVSFNLLKYTEVDNNNITFVLIYAHAGYFSNKHAPYAALAIFMVVFVVIGFPVMLFFSSNLISKKFHYCGNPIAPMSPFFNYFSICYRGKFRRFAGMSLLCRALLLLVNSFVPKDQNLNIILALICCVISVVTSYTWPYKRSFQWLNIFDTMAMMDLFVVSILSVAYSNPSNSKYDLSVISALMNLLMVIPFFVVLIRILYLYLPLIYKKAKKCYYGNGYSETNQNDSPRPSQRRNTDSDKDNDNLSDYSSDNYNNKGYDIDDDSDDESGSEFNTYRESLH